MDEMCILCLSTDRVLSELIGQDKLTLFKFLLKSELANLVCVNYKLCWECMASIDRIYKFQHRALESLRVFKSYLREPKILVEADKLPNYSRLSIAKISSVSFMNSLNIEVKSEIAIEGGSGAETDNAPYDEMTVKEENMIWESYGQYLCEQSTSQHNPSTSQHNPSTLTQQASTYIKSNSNNIPMINNKLEFDNDSIGTDIVSSKNNSEVHLQKNLQLKNCLSESSRLPALAPKPWGENCLSPAKWPSLTIMPLENTITVKSEKTIKTTKPLTWTWQLATEEQFRKIREEKASNILYTRKLYKCRGCIVSFNYPDALERHNHKYHREELGPEVCDICGSRFMTKAQLGLHRTDHYSLYQCIMCEFTANMSCKIREHYNVQHRASIPCNECNLVFETPRRLSKHKYYKHRDSYLCQICNEKFEDVVNFNLHKTSVHPPERVTCEICNKVYSSKYNLTYHMSLVHRQSDTLYYCKECDYIYKNKYTYEAHMKNSYKHVSREDLPYECDYCHKRFSCKNYISVHITHQHLNRVIYQCDYCTKSFRKLNDLRHHVTRNHIETSERIKDFLCDTCGKGFDNPRYLRTHMVTHTKERPYLCKKCPATFGSSGPLYTHNKLVHEKVKKKLPKK